MTVTSTTYQSTATVTCDKGYTANNSSIECLASGSWEVPLCTINGIDTDIDYVQYKSDENIQEKIYSLAIHQFIVKFIKTI